MEFKYHCILSGEEICESHNHSQGQREYDRKQMELLARFHEIDSMSFNFSYLTNLFLFIIKVIATVRSGSLPIVASALDSLLDLLAGAVLWLTKWSMQCINKYKFSIGKSRMQPVVFVGITATLGMQVMLTGIKELIEANSNYNFSTWERVWLVSVMSTVIFSKLGLSSTAAPFKVELRKTMPRLIHANFSIRMLRSTAFII